MGRGAGCPTIIRPHDGPVYVLSGGKGSQILTQIIDSHFMIYILQGRYIPGLHDLAHVPAREAYSLHVLGQVSLVRSVLNRSRTTYQYGCGGSRPSSS